LTPSRERRRLVMIRDAFHRQGPFVGSGGFGCPGPATRAPLLAMREPLDDDLSPPWVLRRSSPVFAPVRPTRDVPFRAMRLPTVSPADPRSELGPRSLDPDRCFCSAFAELIRDQTSPTDFCNCFYDVRATKPGLFDPRRDGDLGLLPFLDVPRPLPCGSGGTRRAALRPPVPAPVLVPLGCPSLPNRDADSNAPPPRLAPPEHSED
jgi:hypothetical protein